MEPQDKNSRQWRDWFARHHFGGLTAASIRHATLEELEILKKYLKDVIEEKRAKK